MKKRPDAAAVAGGGGCYGGERRFSWEERSHCFGYWKSQRRRKEQLSGVAGRGFWVGGDQEERVV